MSHQYFKAIHQIISTGHWVTEQISSQLQPLGVSEYQYYVLRILKVSQPKALQVSEIQARMIHPNSNVTRIIDKLLQKGWVNKEINPTNRRKMNVIITSSGIGALEEMDQKMNHLHNKLSSLLDELEFEKLHKFLSQFQTSP